MAKFRITRDCLGVKMFGKDGREDAKERYLGAGLTSDAVKEVELELLHPATRIALLKGAS